jgi:hypothetical protein
MSKFLKKIETGYIFSFCPRCFRPISGKQCIGKGCGFAYYYNLSKMPFGSSGYVAEYGYYFTLQNYNIHCIGDMEKSYIIENITIKHEIPILFDPKSTEADIDKLLILQ